ncbi:MAG: hypothetical protein KAW12_25645 [Candidatus Aminicenantes bacterium]|nr:hypothetical protein [Candidatus Aminicenantes bacterium]
MKPKLKFLWIDDDPERKRESENMVKRLDVHLDFIDVKDKVLQETLENKLPRDMPDLILMDHMLNKVKGSGIKTGSTAAEVIRERWPECPIVCVTGVDVMKDIHSHQKSLYEEIIRIDNISHSDKTLLAIANSFSELKESRPHNMNDLLNLFNPPEDDRERLTAVIPDDLKKEEFYNDKSLLLSISSWVRHTLMKKPGFLYDRMWAATLLGIKEESFAKVENIFEDAEYRGIFADQSRERWWQSKLLEIIFSRNPDSSSVYSWELGRKLDGITESDFSKCYSSKEDYPEVVAYTDEKSEKRAPVRLQYTVPHPGFEKSLFFEEIRMMKGAE